MHRYLCKIPIFRATTISNGDFCDNSQRPEAVSYGHEKRNPRDWSDPKCVYT